MTHLKVLPLLLKKKFNNEIENIFLHDTGNNLKNLSANISKNVSSTTVVARKRNCRRKKIIFI